MLQFVPLTDDMLFRAEILPTPLVPYQCGLPCRHGLCEEPDAVASADATAMEAELALNG